MRLIRSELLKIWTTNAWWIFAIGAFATLALSLLANGFLATSVNDPTSVEGPSPDETAQLANPVDEVFHAANLYTSGQYFGLLFVMLLGIVLVTNEFQHQTATATFLTTPHRTAVVLAKLAAAAGCGALLWAVTTAINIPVGALVLSGLDVGAHLGDASVTRALLLNLLAYLLWGVFGVGIGVLIRNQLGATITAAALYLIGTQAAQGIFLLLADQFDNEGLLQWQVVVPSLASQLMIIGGAGFPGQPPQWLGAVILIGYAIVTGVIGTAIMRRRDIT